MATQAQRDAERRRRQAAGLDYSSTALDAAVGALDTYSSYTSSYDSGSSSSCSSDSGSSSSSSCD